MTRPGVHRDKGARPQGLFGIHCAVSIAALLIVLSFPSGVLATGSPTIEGESISHLTPTDATLEAEVNPQGAPHGVFYQFQLLHDPGEAPTELQCPSSPPSGYSTCVGPKSLGALPIGFLSGGGSHPVSVDLTNAGVALQPGHTYYYRLLVAPAIPSEDAAEWEAPALVGSSQSFTTPDPPSILSTSVANVTQHDATLQAQIDPQGAASGAFYQFQLLRDPGEAPAEMACPASPPSGFSVCVGPQEPGALPLGFISGGEPQAVSLDLASAGVTLTPGRTYFFRVLAADRIFTEDTAEWEAPAAVGPSNSFTTSAEAPRSGVPTGTGGPSVQLPRPIAPPHHKRHHHRSHKHRASLHRKHAR
jgi:hypothetical protein